MRCRGQQLGSMRSGRESALVMKAVRGFLGEAICKTPRMAVAPETYRQFTATAARAWVNTRRKRTLSTPAPQHLSRVYHADIQTPPLAARGASAHHGRLQQRHRQRLHKLLARLGRCFAFTSQCTYGCCSLHARWLCLMTTRSFPRCDPRAQPRAHERRVRAACSPPEHRQQALQANTVHDRTMHEASTDASTTRTCPAQTS